MPREFVRRGHTKGRGSKRDLDIRGVTRGGGSGMGRRRGRKVLALAHQSGAAGIEKKVRMDF